MNKLTKQILIKMTPSLEETINNAFSAYLKLTGDPITKSEYIRRIIYSACIVYNNEILNVNGKYETQR